MSVMLYLCVGVGMVHDGCAFFTIKMRVYFLACAKTLIIETVLSAEIENLWLPNRRTAKKLFL